MMLHLRRLAALTTLTLLIGCGGGEPEPAPAPAPAEPESPAADPVATETQDMSGTVD
ncbi:hypothetical protein [Tautonia sociabilis]|uniref:hypothetical protein n=1 Tax=Tautonia sociabilis TaxID=2080755 RepID=UPI001315618E|nr:hypothetical protein [Tautonia sociabilis]